ncbi:hypothetical protein HanRHA438_Chr03g0103091 [Helianthus annuus]|nr:hypothetical protein HanRHA438_Chr03g0103091 [Helianthus annuus]
MDCNGIAIKWNEILMELECRFSFLCYCLFEIHFFLLKPTK